MAESSGGPRAVVRRYAPAIALVAAWVGAVVGGRGWHAAHDWMQDAIIRVLAGFPAMQVYALHVFSAIRDDLTYTYGATLFFATLAVPLGAVVRMVARARLRAGHANPLDPVRRVVGASPRWTAALLALGPAALQALFLYAGFFWFRDEGVITGLGTAGSIGAALGVAQWRIARAALRAWLAPTLSGAPTDEALDADEIHFAAVAVTRETRAMVGGLAALTVAAVAWMASLDIQRLYRDPRLFTVMLAYMGVAAASALAFQRASRISVGVDGVRVGGTSRTRFFAYRDLDEAREVHGDILLVRRGRMLLRLQLHGPDATRRAAILDRIRAGIARVAEVERDGAANLVASASPDKVAKALHGGGDYRMPSVSRDALWGLVEGAAVDGAARLAAAKVIVESGTDEERTRVRVAAGHCADPQVRVALEELADEEPEVQGRALVAPRSSRA